jgi:quinoprotein glucose dehydrogenase
VNKHRRWPLASNLLTFFRMSNEIRRFVLRALLPFAWCVVSGSLLGQAHADWLYYGGDAGGMRYSLLTQINPGNVSKLKVAWMFHTGDVSDGKHGKPRSGFETTPILVDGTLFLTTGFNRVIALDPKTGTQRWSYDPKIDPTWDYDDFLVNRGVATWLDPNIREHTGGLCRRRIFEATLDARLVALDAPVFPVEERPVPQSDVPGEMTSPTQPFPTTPPPLTPQKLSAADIWGSSPIDVDTCRNWVRSFRNEGIFTPPSLQGTLVVPGHFGGMTWSGYAFDPERELLLVRTNNMAAVVKLIPRQELEDAHRSGEDREYGNQTGAPYAMYRRFLQASSDLPCSPPPWGMLSAVDMKQGTIRWQVPIGSMQYFGGGHGPIPPGSIGFGGPIITASGLVFIGGTFDPYIRAFAVDTEKELWKAQLPASGNATPMTYSFEGRQYVVIAAGGHPKLTEEAVSDTLVAFSLP